MVAISENKIKPSCFIEFYTRPALLDSVSCSSCGRADIYLSVCRCRRWLQMITHRPHSCAGLVKPFRRSLFNMIGIIGGSVDIWPISAVDSLGAPNHNN